MFYHREMFLPIIPWDDLRNLPLPDLAVALLRVWVRAPGDVNFNSTLRGLQSAEMPPDGERLMVRLAEAWSWLESHGLVVASSSNPLSSNWQQVSAAGRSLASDPNLITKVWADERLAGPIDPLLASARSNFALGDFETAAFAAMKAVEVKVREVAGLPAELVGVALMRKAFSPKDGVLRDAGAEGGEQQATADLFAGAIGAFKNPASHRTVRFEDPVEAAEVLQLADLLLRSVRRAEERRLSQDRPQRELPPELTEERVQERWLELRQVAETLKDRIAKRGEFDFATGTSYAGDDARLNPYLMSTAFHNCLAASIDHLHAATVLVVDVQVLHMSAGASLARGLLENAAVAFWMLRPQSRPERRLRTLRWWAKNANDQQAGTSGLPESARGQSKDEIIARLIEVADRNGVEGSVTGGYTSTAALTYADDVAVSKDGSHIGPLLPWQLCSGFAQRSPVGGPRVT